MHRSRTEPGLADCTGDSVAQLVDQVTTKNSLAIVINLFLIDKPMNRSRLQGSRPHIHSASCGQTNCSQNPSNR